VVVPLAGTVPGAVGAAATTASPEVRPGLGSATVEQLDEIDGIGPTLAERIVEYRTENGGFGSLDELQEVDGIGEKRFETLREALQP
jgi:competence protein ComEA